MYLRAFCDATPATLEGAEGTYQSRKREEAHEALQLMEVRMLALKCSRL